MASASETSSRISLEYTESTYLLKATTTRAIPKLAYVAKMIYRIVESFIPSSVIRFDLTYK